MDEISIEERIRKYYCAENGEWLAEKGKVKEAKLLKEACEEIEKLRRQYANSELLYWKMFKSTTEKEQEIKERENCIAEREKKFEDRKASFIRDFEKWV